MGYRYLSFQVWTVDGGRWLPAFYPFEDYGLSVNVPWPQHGPHRLLNALCDKCRIVIWCNLWYCIWHRLTLLLDFSLPFPVSQCAQDLFTVTEKDLLSVRTKPIWCWIHCVQWWAWKSRALPVFSNMYVTHISSYPEAHPRFNSHLVCL